MASPHPPYPHPGPSSYYPPPPPQFYGHGPGPATFYPYPMPPVNGHMPMHQPTSPRMNGSARGRFNPHRGGGPSYHYPPMPPQHHLHPPAPVHSPPPVTPASPFTHPQKFSPHAHQIMYSPNYHPQPTGPYQPAWSTQPLSPLPKQLSMLPPVVAQPPPHFEPEPKPEVQFVPELPSTSPRVSTLPTRPDVQLISPSTSALQPESSAKTTSESPMSSIPLSPKVKVSHAAPERPSTPTRPPSSSWVIWSRRPGDPSRAPGIIISPRAFPPEDVIQKALELPSPPVSPKPEVLELPLLQASALEDVHSVTGSPARAGVPSSSATEATTCSTTDTPVPGSPLSSTTSISVAAASPLSGSFAKLAISPKVEVNMEIATAEEMEVSATVTPSASGTTPVASSEAVPEAAAPASPPISTPAPTPSASTSKPSALKKSWASLLQSADATASSSKSRLPVSSVMGFSIPADSLSGSSIAPGATVAPSHREELLSLLSSGPSPSNTPLKVRPRGLINTGNLCFANAVLQTLVYCPPFHRLFSELRRYLAGPVAGSQKEGSNATPLVDATVQFLKEFVPDPPSAFLNHKSKGKEREDDNFDELDSFIPSYVYDAMKEKKRFANMIGGHQEDAEEFLGFFLDALEEELLSISNSLSPKDPKTAVDGPQSQPHQDDGWLEVGKRNRSAFTRTIKSTESPITRIFGGKFRSTLRTPHQRDSVTVEDWRSLRLDIQPEQVRTIKDALQHISHEQDVQISIPTRPGVVLDASQQSLIEALPPVLILHLKRFLYDTTVGDVVKVCKQVTFAPELEVGPDLIAPSQRTTQPVKYQLFGVIYHHGPSASGGHYTLDVLHPNRDLTDRPRPAWIRIDDELVSDVRPEDVFGGQDRDDRHAYLLFYRRIGAWGPTRT